MATSAFKLLPDTLSEVDSELTCRVNLSLAGRSDWGLMGEVIFLRSGNNLTVMRETPYQTEAVLQDALTQFPEVIAGVSTAGDSAVGLLLIKEEKAVKDPDEASMSLDHLFVDANGVPVLVEVKRSSDRRIYRAVVGQLLEYAANGVKNWPPGSLRGDFERQFPSQQDANDHLSKVTGEDDVESFWMRVDENLRDGRIRLIIVADRLPAGVVRIIEFLNEQMRDAEVLAVEVAQHVNPGDPNHVVYVPRLRGQTQRAQNVKVTTTANRTRWDRDRYLAETHARNPGNLATVALVEKLLDDTTDPRWGVGVEPGVGGWYPIGGRQVGVWELYGGGTAPDRPPSLTVSLQRLANAGVNIDDIAERLEKLPAFADAVKFWRGTPSRQPNGKLDKIASDPAQVDELFAIVHAATSAGSIGPAADTSGPSVPPPAVP